MTCRRVLLVEDSSPRRAEYRRQLESWGFEVLEAADGTEIAPLIERHAVHAIVSDTDMPRMDGDRAIRQLVADGQLGGVLVVGISSERSYESRWQALARAFFHKPRIRDLGELISAMLAGSGAARQTQPTQMKSASQLRIQKEQGRK